MKLNTNNKGEPLGSCELSEDEFSELILLIDDEPVDEEVLDGIRRKLVHRRKILRRKIREGSS